jgi:uncharacterized membrane protein
MSIQKRIKLAKKTRKLELLFVQQMVQFLKNPFAGTTFNRIYQRLVTSIAVVILISICLSIILGFSKYISWTQAVFGTCFVLLVLVCIVSVQICVLKMVEQDDLKTAAEREENTTEKFSRRALVEEEIGILYKTIAWIESRISYRELEVEHLRNAFHDMFVRDVDVELEGKFRTETTLIKVRQYVAINLLTDAGDKISAKDHIACLAEIDECTRALAYVEREFVSGLSYDQREVWDRIKRRESEIGALGDELLAMTARRDTLESDMAE